MSSPHQIVVLLIDDQQIVGEAVRRMLAPEKDILFYFCSDPTQAINKAKEVTPTVILQDLVMPEMDGLTLVKFFRANKETREVPLIVLSSKEEPVTKAEAFGLGANDYLVKLPDKIELIARIRHHSRGYINLLERNEAYRQLEASQKQLAEELARAARYVQSLLPEPFDPKKTKNGQVHANVSTNWRFVPSTDLGGDVFGYHWIDEDHLGMFLLDVSGHGVGPALLAVSTMNVLSGQALPATDFRDPSQVLKGLNDTFAMEKHNNLYFTIWYGVYNRKDRKLRYGGGGHPAGILFTGPDASSATVKLLECEGPPIGVISEYEFVTETCDLDSFAVLYLYSDGAFEISRPDGSMWTHPEFIEYLSKLPSGEGNPMDTLLQHVRDMHKEPVLADDFSILQVQFG